MGKGVDNTVTGFSCQSYGTFYVGGHFHRAGDISVNGIASFNTLSNEWSNVPGGGVTGLGAPYVADFRLPILFSPDLYIGGEFTSAGGVIAHNVARLDNGKWWPLGVVLPSFDPSNVRRSRNAPPVPPVERELTPPPKPRDGKKRAEH